MSYARGGRAWGICQRSGKRLYRRDMLEDGQEEGMLVAPEWWEPRHPQEIAVDVDDPMGLSRASPENQNALPIDPPGSMQLVLSMVAESVAYTLVYVPACPTLTSPADGATGQPADLDLTWAAAPHSDSYNVYVNGVLVTNTAALTYHLSALTGGATYTWQIRSVIGAAESSGCTTRSFTVATAAVAWAPATLGPHLHLSNSNRDASALPEGFLNQYVKSDAALSAHAYAEVLLVGDSYADETSWPYTPDPISVSLSTVAADLSGGTLDFLAIGAYGIQIGGVYQTQTSGGFSDAYANTVQVGTTAARPASVPGDRRRVMIAWDKAGGQLFMGFGGTWVWGNPTGGGSAKAALSVPANTDLRIGVQNIIQARGSFTAVDLIEAIPSGYTAWDGST